ncbi:MULTISPECIES: MarR family winged helix-turn-helix transcriptional regulator [unclassified Schaalia]|uniref:MarR family winged helix-turn-helix transcriptional regulator n=1 Tax=unclassified Schaalia TaxID=2691889 RepID=UPI001E4DF168|nr:MULTISPECIES: MarR family winged helix-turn-helix transcriptional regulator [unclassified Schaalia]MCD4549578.1 MarR family winged helix-turn-helix transcriptional regulator [Schaalia sp. lx-260]MCD4556641.1 MarR family winged helix-turn-helix transcriptional regulator [Schaalia sp. lx-100]
MSPEKERTCMDMKSSSPDGHCDARSRAWHTFFRATVCLQNALEDRLKKKLSISLADYNILIALHAVPDRSMRMGQLAAHVYYSPSRVTYLVTQLTKDGYIAHVQSQEDARAVLVSLTEQGMDVVHRAYELHQELVRELIIRELEEDKVDALVDIFNDIEGHLASVYDEKA